MPDDEFLVPLPPELESLRARTPARILTGRAGSAYRTPTQLDLRKDHAAAVDAVHADLDIAAAWGSEFIERWRLFCVYTWARTKNEYLMRPDLGRRLDDDARRILTERCPRGAGLQVVLGDGLSATATAKQAPALLPLLQAGARERGWTFGQPFVVLRARVGVLNDIGDILEPDAVVLLIGERPGLATAESLSAYMTYRPRPGHTDAQRNLISNIHARGVTSAEAAERILALAAQMHAAQTSGVAIKEDLSKTRQVPGENSTSIPKSAL